MENIYTKRDIVAKFEKYLDDKGLSRVAFATRKKISPSSLSNFLNHGKWSDNVIYAICSVLDINYKDVYYAEIILDAVNKLDLHYKCDLFSRLSRELGKPI